jgi:signal transduction histidine kinase
MILRSLLAGQNTFAFQHKPNGDAQAILVNLPLHLMTIVWHHGEEIVPAMSYFLNRETVRGLAQKSAYIFAALSLCLFLPRTAVSETQPMAIDGVMDLRNWDFDQHKTISLTGNWRVAWGVHKTELAVDARASSYPQTVKMPGLWKNSIEAKKESDFKTQTHATYVLDIILPSTVATKDLAIHADSANPATLWTIYQLDNATILGTMQQGHAGQTYASTMPVWIPSSTQLAASDSSRIRIQAYVSNFRYPNSGFNTAPLLGTKAKIKQHEASNLFLNAITLGILIIIGWYHFVVYLQRREDKASLAFALWCATFALRTAITARFPQILGIESALVNFNTLVALEFISIPLTVVGCAYFLHALIPTQVSKYILIFSGLTTLLLILMTVTTTPFFYAAKLHLYQAHLVICAVLYIGYLFSQIKVQDNQAAWVLFTFFILLFGAINDILHSQDVISSVYIAHYAFIAFVFLQSAILSGKFAKTYQKAAHLSANLQEEVSIQTASLVQISNREMKHVKTLLQQSEKLSQLGVMIASIGHEIVNPVSVISNSLDLQEETLTKLKERLEPKHEDSRTEKDGLSPTERDFSNLAITTKACRSSIEKLMQMTHALGTQSRQETVHAQKVCLNEIVREVIVLTAGRVNGHDLQKDLGTLPLVSCHRSQVGQILINLLVNASDAVGTKYQRETKMGVAKHGLIEIITRAKTLSDVEGVLIEINDSGDGVPEEIRDKIFTEFFTTKDVGSGTGLGLAICVKIAHDHGGKLTVDQAPNLGGARFQLWLPVDFDPAPNIVTGEEPSS